MDIRREKREKCAGRKEERSWRGAKNGVEEKSKRQRNASYKRWVPPLGALTGSGGHGARKSSLKGESNGCGGRREIGRAGSGGREADKGGSPYVHYALRAGAILSSARPTELLRFQDAILAHFGMASVGLGGGHIRPKLRPDDAVFSPNPLAYYFFEGATAKGDWPCAEGNNCSDDFDENGERSVRSWLLRKFDTGIAEGGVGLKRKQKTFSAWITWFSRSKA
ncbi:hypothetical protein KM043_005356 [Ampulex compressa]|nr:hypothetical protein KM043_005356 [Ampulex compressa]